MLRTNVEKTVKGSVVGKIRTSNFRNYVVSQKGEAHIVQGIGGISYNVKLGDSVMDWAGDHIEPGVSFKNDDKQDSDNMIVLSCIGNEVTMWDGKGDGKKGKVIGTHGGAESLIVHFEDETLDLLCPGDKALVKTWGQGLKLLDYPEIIVQSIDPELLQKLGIEENGDGTITVPVAAKVPAYLMGSGVGSTNSYRGDYDIMLHDTEKVKELGLDNLKFGDLVLLEDCDNVYGRGYFTGAVSIGVIVHSDCLWTGHGPGVTTILSSQKPLIKGKLDPKANLKTYFEK